MPESRTAHRGRASILPRRRQSGRESGLAHLGPDWRGADFGQSHHHLREKQVTDTQKIPSDALVFFGATGDLAFKQIFPALLALVERHGLNIPIVGVAKAGWNLDQFRQRAEDSLKAHGGFNEASYEKLLQLLKYVD